MPRKARVDLCSVALAKKHLCCVSLAKKYAPGVLHHIIMRGINRRKIFFDDSDRDNLLDPLGGMLSDSKTACFAWAFMTNHLVLGDMRTMDECGLQIQKTEHRVLHGWRIRDEKTANWKKCYQSLNSELWCYNFVSCSQFKLWYHSLDLDAPLLLTSSFLFCRIQDSTPSFPFPIRLPE